MKKKLLLIPILIIMAALIINPARYIRSINEGLMIFAISVLPALFPFFFFTKLLTALGVAGNISYYMQKPVSKLYNSPGPAGYILIMSIMSGYPIGAKLIADFYDMNAITSKEAKRVSAFTSSSGPLFILGTVGSSILINYKAGLIILISHYLATLLNGFIYRGKTEANTLSAIKLPPVGYDKALSESVYSAIISILTVGSYIALFNLIGDILTDIKLLPLVDKGLELLLNLVKLPPTLSCGISYSLIEMTRGCIYLSQSGASIKVIAPLVAFSVTFGGLGIAIQSLTYLTKCKVPPLYYITTKLSQSVIAFVICLLLCLVIPL
ncbi:MAG: hypothetical protein EOM87_03510 [Clostridia bacterium]|nr:hypothetical protein [Clostridia bacterium]